MSQHEFPPKDERPRLESPQLYGCLMLLAALLIPSACIITIVVLLINAGAF